MPGDDRLVLQRLVRELTARAERAETERDAARSVIRRYEDGWHPSPVTRTPTKWRRTRDGVDESEPMTPVEVAEIHAATRQPQGPE